MALIEISSWTELDAIRADLSATASYLLTRSLLKTDVDYVGIGDSWIPLGENVGAAECQFDMNGFTIEGLTVTGGVSYCNGLFHQGKSTFSVSNGTFDDASISNVLPAPPSGTYVRGHGVVVGQILHSSPGWSIRNIKIINSRINDGNTTQELNGAVVGVVGDLRGAGGVDGNVTDGVIEDCSVVNCNIGGNNYNAGITGWLRGGTIRRCNVRDTIIAPGRASETYSGGICVALGSSLIEDCYVDGISLDGRYSFYYSGGIAARLGAGISTIRRCWVGTASYSATSTPTSARRSAIASVASGTTNVSDCYYDVDGYAWRGSGGGTAKTTAEMYQQATFTNWDFDDVWYIQEGEDYPRLRGVDVPPVPTMATMPTIIGLNIDAADALLLSSMLTTGTVSAVSGVGELYTVISQQYPPGAELEIGTAVDYTILVPATDRDGFKTVIGYDNILSRSDVTLTASSTAPGTFVENVADGTTYDYWKSGEGVS